MLSWFPDSKESKAVIDKLPEKFRSGLMWIDDHDWYTYLCVYLASVVFFFCVYFMLKWLFSTT